MFWKITIICAAVAGTTICSSAAANGMTGMSLWLAGGLTIILVVIAARTLRGR